MTYAIYELTVDGEVCHDFHCTAASLYDAFQQALREHDWVKDPSKTDAAEIKQRLQDRLASIDVKVRHAFRPKESELIARALTHLDFQSYVNAKIKEVGDPDNSLEVAQSRAIFGLRRAMGRRFNVFSLKDSQTYRDVNSDLLMAVVSCDEVCLRLMPGFTEEPRSGGFICEAYNKQRPELEM